MSWEGVNFKHVKGGVNLYIMVTVFFHIADQIFLSPFPNSIKRPLLKLRGEGGFQSIALTTPYTPTPPTHQIIVMPIISQYR